MSTYTCAVVPPRFSGADAEFDDEADPDMQLGRLIVLAFGATPE